MCIYTFFPRAQQNELKMHSKNQINLQFFIVTKMITIIRNNNTNELTLKNIREHDPFPLAPYFLFFNEAHMYYIDCENTSIVVC